MVVTSPYGIGGPAGMDPAIVKKLHDAFHKAMQDPAHDAIMDKIGFVEDYLNTEDYEKFAMEFIEEQKAMVEELGLSKKYRPHLFPSLPFRRCEERSDEATRSRRAHIPRVGSGLLRCARTDGVNRKSVV